MSATFTLGGTTLSPVVMHSYESDQEAQTIVHPIVARAEPDVTLRPADLRTGTLNLVFAGEAASEAARVAFGTLLGVWQCTHPERPTVNMRFVVVGRIVRGVPTTGAWPITVGFQELPA